MSCDCCEQITKDSKLDSKELEMIQRIEAAVGFAININMTNFYKREVMKDVIEAYTYSFDTDNYGTPEDLKEAKENWKKQLLEDLDKVATAPDGYSATKEYVNIVTKLL